MSTHYMSVFMLAEFILNLVALWVSIITHFSQRGIHAEDFTYSQ